MRILVYGAGNIGSLYAARLSGAGEDVSILARGPRLAEIEEHGIRLENGATGERTTTRVAAVERLHADDAYDLVLVVLPRDRVAEVLPSLAANRHTPSVMFFGNNAAGPRDMIDALGRDRVLLGFPGAAGVAGDHGIRYLIVPAREQPSTIGELDGTRSERIETIAAVLKAAGFPVHVCPRMNAWLKTHVAEIGPTAYALYLAGTDAARLARTRDALVLMLRAIREGYAVLSRLGIPITPGNHRIFEWLPEPLLVALMRQKIGSETTSIKIGHALGARSEMRALAGEFRELIRSADVPTPAIDRLHRHLDPQVDALPDGSAEIPLDWKAVWLMLGVVAVLAVLLSLVL